MTKEIRDLIGCDIIDSRDLIEALGELEHGRKRVMTQNVSRLTGHPNQYQFAAFDADWNLVHAGVHGAARVSRKAALKNQRKWMRWVATRPDASKGRRCVYISMCALEADALTTVTFTL